MPNAILDPTGQASGKQAVMASRSADLRGATVGLLATPKQNADLFLEEVGRLLVDREGAAGVVPRTKTSVAMPAPEDLVAELTGRCDVIVTGVGD